jgi:chromosome partitioning protein
VQEIIQEFASALPIRNTMLIAVVNQKGGAGKTTLSVHLAVHLFDQGLRVAFVDNDPQASATKWLGSVEPGVPLHSTYDSRQLVDLLQQLNETHDVVIADAAPRLNDQTHVLMYFAKRVLIPVKPSVLDLQATLETKAAVDRVAAAGLADNADEIDV